jgi:hypothetical protein
MEIIKKITIVLICLWASCGWAATYYLRVDGEAANKEAATGPCSTAANTMTEAVHDGEAFSGDDIIIVCSEGGGITTFLDLPSSGSDGSPITYRGDGAGPHFVRTDATCVNLTAIDYITFEDLVIEGGSSTAGALDIEAGSDHIIIDGCTFTVGAADKGIRLYANSASISNITIQNSSFDGQSEASAMLVHVYAAGGYSVNNLTITNNTFLDAGDEHIYFYYQDASSLFHTVKINNNTFTNGADNGIQIDKDDADANKVDTYCYGVDINNNTFSGTNRDAIEIEMVTSTTATSYVRHNTISNVGDGSETNVNGLRIGCNNAVQVDDNKIDTVVSASGDGNGLIIDSCVIDGTITGSDGVLAFENEITGCDTIHGAGISNYRSDNSSIYNNISYDNIIGISWGEDSGSTEQSSGGVINNNTLAYNSAFGGKIRENALSSTWTNNIAWGNTTYGFALIADGTAPTSNNNCVEDFAPDDATYDAWTDTNGIISDPLLSSTYRPLPGSPAIDAGVCNVGVSTDYDGYSRDGVYVKNVSGTVYYDCLNDIGAYEYNGGSGCDDVTAADTGPSDLQAAADATGASDTLHICTGTYTGLEIDGNSNLTLSGTMNIYAADGDVVIDGDGNPASVISWTGITGVNLGDGVHTITITGGTYRSVSVAAGSDDATINKVIMTGSVKYGMTAVDADGVTVQNSTISNNGETGAVFTDCEDLVFKDNNVIGNGTDDDANLDGVEIDGCVNYLISGSLFSSNKGTVGVGGLDINDSATPVVSSGTVESSIFTDNDVVGLLMKGAGTHTVQNNLMYRNATYEFYFGDNADGGTVNLYNNVMFSDSATNIIRMYDVTDTGATLNMFNNILYGSCTYGIYYDGDDSTITSGYNIFYFTGETAFANAVDGVGAMTFANWVTTHEGGSQTSLNEDTDPLFLNPSANNFRLKSGSPAIDAGVLIAGIHVAGWKDASGWGMLCNEPDIGAYEYRGSDDFPIFPIAFSGGCQVGDWYVASTDSLLLETGDYILLESGDKLLLE